MKKLSSPFELIKKAVDIFSKKENLIFLLQIYTPVAFFSLLSVIQSYLPSSIKDSTSPGMIALAVSLQVLNLLVSVFVAAAGIIALKKVVDGSGLEVKKTFKSVWKVYWAFLLLSIVLTLVYLVGFVLLIVPGVILVVWFAFSRFLMIEKNLKLKESLAKSREMVKGMFWKVLGRLIVIGLFMILIEVVLSVIPFGIGSIVGSLCGGLFLLPLYLLYKEVSG